MTELEFLEKNNKALHITGVRGSILSPLDWIKNVQGKSHLEYLDEIPPEPSEVIQLMEWYGDYVGRKVKEYCHHQIKTDLAITYSRCCKL